MSESAPPPSVVVPWWIRGLDVATVATALMLVSNVVFDGFRFRAGGIRITATSAWRIALLAIVLGGLRHALLRTPPVHQRVIDAVQRAWRSNTRAIILPPFIASRLMVLFVGLASVMIIGFAPNTPPIRISNNELINLPLRWDAGWYMQLALEGYDYHADWTAQRPQNIAFFPAYPIIVRIGAAWLGSRSTAFGDEVLGNRVEWEHYQHRKIILSSMIVSLAAFAWALVYLFHLAREMLDEDAAIGAVMVACAYPYSLFFGAMYTESLFLLTSVAAFYHLRRDEWAQAALWGLLAGLTRPNGCLLSVPFAIVAIQRAWAPGQTRPSSARLMLGLAAAAAPGIGMLMYSAWLWDFTGRPLAWMDAHRAWGRVSTDVQELLSSRAKFIWSEGPYKYFREEPIELFNAAPTLLVLLIVPLIVRRVGLAAGVLIVLMLVPPLFRGAFLSLGRVTSTLFPLFLFLGYVCRGHTRSGVIMAMAGVQAFLAVLFFTWRPFF